ncbi:F-box/FBD/LRR-repeat protein [Raphanus sativus]|uniref:F-box/FBD/LRR-repeat protein At4g13965 n=1 Tax=Raphanus sativus TaxID=3726 RepID=A0A6J0K7H4_RAPSA|nr:putative F-box/FBD/LRR-repeat protein At4g13965 [Raphanus sativus]KAJ4883938.1 F-box/FBD/LRR-repeat protein [Raphanus sativus]
MQNVLSKRSCQRNDEGVDRISKLPEARVFQILSLLPQRDVVTTSVLSKRWNAIWKMVPKLEFDYQHYGDGETFSDNVCRVLISNKAPDLESLCLRFSIENCARGDIESWISIAYLHRVRELELDVAGPSSLKLPLTLLFSRYLDTLKLKNFILVDSGREHRRLKYYVRTLHLCYVNCKNDDSVADFLCGCHVLENLVVSRRRWDYVKSFTIDVPTLQRLEICDWNWNGQDKEQDQEFGYYEINAPCLKYLKIKGTRDILFRLVASDEEDHLLGRIRNVSLSSRSSLISEIAFPKYTIFHQLEYLELCTSQAMWCNLLTLVINTCPRLQVLKLIGCGWDSRKVCVAGRWIQPKNVPECLETFVWNCCSKEQQEKEKGVAKYIVRNANRLKEARIIMKEFNSRERLKMLEEFKSVVKASNSSCNILVVE